MRMYLNCQQLEEREVPSIYTWTGDGTSVRNYNEVKSFTAATYYWQVDGATAHSVPGASDVIIIPSGTCPVDFNTATGLGSDLLSCDAITISNGQINKFAHGTTTVGGLFTLNGGSTVILDGDVNLNQGFIITGSTLSDSGRSCSVLANTSYGGSFSGNCTLGLAGMSLGGITLFGNSTNIYYTGSENGRLNNYGTMRVVDGQNVNIEVGVTNNSSGIVQVGDSVTGTDATLTVRRGLKNFGGYVVVLKGSLTCQTVASVATGDTNWPNCEIYSDGGIIKVSTDAAINAPAGGIYLTNNSGLDSVYDGHGLNALVNSSIFVNNSNIGLDTNDGSGVFDGSGGGAAGLVCTGNISFYGTGSICFNVDFTVPMGQVSHLNANNITFNGTTSFVRSHTIGSRGSITNPNWSWAVILCNSSSTGAGHTNPGQNGIGAPFDGAYAALDDESYGVYIGIKPSDPLTGVDE